MTQLTTNIKVSELFQVGIVVRNLDESMKLYKDLLGIDSWQVVEMDNNREEAFCCSAGGGRILAEERIGERINVRRVQMAADTGAEVLLSNCPFCLTMFEDGVKGADVEESLKPKDIAEILVDRLEQS